MGQQSLSAVTLLGIKGVNEEELNRTPGQGYLRSCGVGVEETASHTIPVCKFKSGEIDIDERSQIGILLSHTLLD